MIGRRKKFQIGRGATTLFRKHLIGVHFVQKRKQNKKRLTEFKLGYKDNKGIIMNEKINNHYEALVLALKLSISAPTEEQSQRALADAQLFADNLSEIEVERAKKEAEAALEGDA